MTNDENETSLDVQHESLTTALAVHAIELPPPQIEMLDRYCRLLWAWNEKLNLTRHTDYDTFVIRDVVDSLALGKLLGEGAEALDVGTGGGVPGVILAIVRPDLNIALCESVGKRAAAVKDIVEQLGLHLPIFHERAEDHFEDSRYDAVVARAVAPLWKMLQWFEPHWLSIGTLYVIKGSRWLEERAAARERGLLKKLQLRKAAQYATPSTGAVNVILQVARK